MPRVSVVNANHPAILEKLVNGFFEEISGELIDIKYSTVSIPGLKVPKTEHNAMIIYKTAEEVSGGR
ncbi:sporulation protein Cse60 [Neobacillus sp. NPDC093127]|uniref:sporulation protein Cse60 n=1 Tax=Neobacillus sp. NPDC093127 TaxID=3364296 RepID=UPI00382F9595